MPMMDSFNKLNLAIRKVLEKADNFAAELDKVYQDSINKKVPGIHRALIGMWRLQHGPSHQTEHIEQVLPELKKQIPENYCAAVHTVRAVIRHLDETKGAAMDTAK